MIVMVTGGQRSGKSALAEEMALKMSDSPKYIATSRVLDDEMRMRVERHRLRRGPAWTLFEEPLLTERIPLQAGDTALFDCVTMWVANWFFECGDDAAKALPQLRQRLEDMAASGASIIFVTNEVGLGGVAPNAMQRAFTDLQGSINQTLASLADEVYLCVAGIPVKIK